MLTESKCKLLTLAIGECWHERTEYVADGMMLRCLDCKSLLRWDITTFRRTFDSGNDWELVLEKVVRPNIEEFYNNAWHSFKMSRTPSLSWFLTLSIEERMELVVSFGKERLGWGE